jgi:hypothetical protein
VIKLASRGAAVVLAGSALTLAAGMLPAQAATTGWRIDTTVVAPRGSAILFTNVAASSPSDAWAAGLVGQTSGSSAPQTAIRHWTGKAWRVVTLPAKIAREWASQDPTFAEVGAASARSVWVFGGLGGGYLRLDGSRWSFGQLPGGGGPTSGALIYIDAVKVFGSSNVWAFGVRESISGSQEVTAPYSARYDGGKWSSVTVPGSGGISAVAATSSKDMWAVEGAVSAFGTPIAAGPTPPVVLQWTAHRGWRDAAKRPPLTASDQLTSAVAEPNGDVWFGGSASNRLKGTTPLAAEWTGTRWSVKNLPTRATSADWSLGAMTPDGTGGIWALAQASDGETAQIWHLHGKTWSQASPAFGKGRWTLLAIAQVPGTHSVWSVGAALVGTGGANGLIAVDGPLPR